MKSRISGKDATYVAREALKRRRIRAAVRSSLARRTEKGGRRGTQGNGGWEADLQRNERWAGAWGGGPKKILRSTP